MSKSIKIPEIGMTPIRLRINCTDYVFHAGETQTVPDEVAALLAGIVESFPKPASDGYRTKPATIGDVEDMIAAVGGSDLPEVTSDDNGKFLGVTAGAWGKVDAPSGGTYDVPFTATMESGSLAVSTEASFEDALSAANEGNMVRAAVNMGSATTYIPLESVYFNGESYQLIFSIVADFSGISYVRLIWDAQDAEVGITPLGS